MGYLFIEYPKCSTCQKARKWLEENKVEYQDRHIVEECPSEKELATWIKKSGYSIKKFFNTSGLVYKNQNMKEKLQTLSGEEQIKLLASNGMLIKRPLLIKDKTILVGFKEQEWEQAIQ